MLTVPRRKYKRIERDSTVVVAMKSPHFGFMVDANGDPVNWFYAFVVSLPSGAGDSVILEHINTGHIVYLNPSSSDYIGLILVDETPKPERDDATTAILDAARAEAR